MPPRRGTRTRTKTRTALATATATTLMTYAAIRALIAQSVANALAEQEIQRYTNLNGDGSQGFGSGITRPVRPTHELSSISVIVQSRTKSSTCTLLGAPLTWLDSHVKIVAHDATYDMPWKTLLEMVTVKYCPRSEIKKLEIEIWNLKVKSTDVVGYSQRFQELALMCGRMFPKKYDEVEKYVGGLPDMIQGNVMSVRPKTMQEAIELTNNLIDQKVYAYAETQAINKRKFDNNNQAQQQLPKRQNCANCKKVGHLTRDRWNPTATCNQRTITCYEYRNQGCYKFDFPELKNRNNGNQVEGTKARGMVYSLGGGETNQDLDDMEDDINA
ncbi:reverse transcriptase domain-containing protein [Tanacetum coccineum]